MNIGKETEYVEFKESTSELKAGLESIAAMLNKHCKATIFFGVKDNGDVIGQLIGKDTVNDIVKAIRTRIDPNINPTINILNHNKKQYIKVYATGYNKPYAVDGQYLIRLGTSNKKMTPEDLRTLILNAEGDLTTQMISNNQDLSFNQLKQLYIANNIKINQNKFFRI